MGFFTNRTQEYFNELQRFNDIGQAYYYGDVDITDDLPPILERLEENLSRNNSYIKSSIASLDHKADELTKQLERFSIDRLELKSLLIERSIYRIKLILCQNL